MAFWHKVFGTSTLSWQIGLGTGPRLFNNGGVLESRDSTGAALAVARGADPVGNTDFVTKQAQSFRETQYAEVISNVTTSSTAFVTLLSAPITTSASSILVVHFSASIMLSANNLLGRFVLVVDGVTVKGATITAHAASDRQSVVIVYRKTGMTASTHTVVIQWASSTSGSAIACDVISNPTMSHASLLVEEVTV